MLRVRAIRDVCCPPCGGDTLEKDELEKRDFHEGSYVAWR